MYKNKLCCIIHFGPRIMGRLDMKMITKIQQNDLQLKILTRWTVTELMISLFQSRPLKE